VLLRRGAALERKSLPRCVCVCVWSMCVSGEGGVARTEEEEGRENICLLVTGSSLFDDNVCVCVCVCMCSCVVCRRAMCALLSSIQTASILVRAVRVVRVVVAVRVRVRMRMRRRTRSRYVHDCTCVRVRPAPSPASTPSLTTQNNVTLTSSQMTTHSLTCMCVCACLLRRSRQFVDNQS
jgi:hypothetical protein